MKQILFSFLLLVSFVALAQTEPEALPQYVHWPALMSSMPKDKLAEIKESFCDHGCTIMPDELLDHWEAQMMNDAQVKAQLDDVIRQKDAEIKDLKERLNRL